MSFVFPMNPLNSPEENFLPNQSHRWSSASPYTDAHTMNVATIHNCTQLCPRNCMQATLPNNRDDRMPVLIESKLNPAGLRLTTVPQTSKFSNFGNLRAWLENLTKDRSKYFDVSYPSNEKAARSKGGGSVCDSLGSSQSCSSIDEINRSDSESSANSASLNCPSVPPGMQPNYPPPPLPPQQRQQQQQKQPKANAVNEEVRNFNLHTNPVQFNLEKVSYVRTLAETRNIIETVVNRAKVIAVHCDSDCSLQDGIDLLEVAVMDEMSLEHPRIFVFDTHLQPKIVELFKPVLADPAIVKVMFDPRFDLRILSRKYGVTEFVALFDLQLAYRLLLAKKTGRPLEEIRREKLLYVSWQCNGPMANLERLCPPSLCHLKNRPFWKVRPVNFEIMYRAAYDVFVMVPQLFTNLVVIMECALTETGQRQFIRLSNELIARNLVPRKFAFFRTRKQYLGEVHKQIDLLIQSDILHRNRQSANWRNQSSDSYRNDGLRSVDGKPLPKSPIDDLSHSDSYKSFDSNGEEDLIYFSDNQQSSSDGELSDGQFDNFETFGNHSAGSSSRTRSEHSLSSGTRSLNGSESGTCGKCKLPIKSDDKLTELIVTLETKSPSLNQLLFSGDQQQYCQCVRRWEEEAKCMNLLVDQIIDLAECKEDYMELDE